MVSHLREKTFVSQARRGLPLMTMPQEPQMPMLQLYRMASELSWRSLTAEQVQDAW